MWLYEAAATGMMRPVSVRAVAADQVMAVIS